MECGKANAYLASWLWESIQTQAHTLHSTGTGREEGVSGRRRGKDSQKPSDPIQKHIPLGKGTSAMTAPPTRSNLSIVLDSPSGQSFRLFAEIMSPVTYTPNQKGFAARPPDLAFLVALELPRLLVEVSPTSLFCFLYWKLC